MGPKDFRIISLEGNFLLCIRISPLSDTTEQKDITISLRTKKSIIENIIKLRCSYAPYNATAVGTG